MGLQTPEAIRTLQEKLHLKAKAEPAFRFYLLYDKVWREDILAHALALSRANGGAPGVDGETFARIAAQGEGEWLARLREELRTKTYRPAPVRRVMIPKPGGGERPLGIPTIRDRVVQTAARLVLEPIFEADLQPEAYGYRPHRSAIDAIAAVQALLRRGHTDVVDGDLSKYFDTIPHDDLMQCVARRVSDKHMLALIKAWLKVPVEETDDDGRKRLTGGRTSTRGTPQGGIVSPMLANLYMNRFLKYWKLKGLDERLDARIVNYADDFVILCRGSAAEALAWTEAVMQRLGLTINRDKTRLCDATTERFDFLGYSFGPHWHTAKGIRYLGASPSKKSVARAREKVGVILDRHPCSPWPVIRDDLNAMIRGWANYFGHGTRYQAFRAVERYIGDSVQHFLARRHKNPTRGSRCFGVKQVFGRLGVLRPRDAAPKRA